MIKKFLVSLAIVAVFAFYSDIKGSEKQETAILPKNNKSSLSQSTPSSTPAPADTSTPAPVSVVNIPGQSASPTPVPSTPTPTPSHQGQYKDGTYTGPVADAFYGNVQIQVKISNGLISDVQFLQYPNDRNTSIMINSQAMPMLQQEAIQSQTGNVDIISGATDTSNAFIQSLTSALSQAK